MKDTTTKKKPIGIWILLIWLVLAAVRGIAKLFNGQRLAQNGLIFGKSLAILEYGIDVLILIATIVLIILFVKRVKNTWKYLTSLLIVKMIGLLIGAVYVIFAREEVLSVISTLRPDISESFMFASMIGGTIVILLFYGLLIYLNNKNKEYFTNKLEKIEQK